jgi:subtilisin-like proprotein convertase family protein
MKIALASVLLAASFLIGCGPSVSQGGDDDMVGDDEGGGPDAQDCTPSPEVCTGALDEDCDGYFDCTDVDCYGIGSCPNGPNGNCGTLDLTEGQPLALPDSNTSTPTATCAPVTGLAQYTSSINFTGFSDGQVLEAATDILGICVEMEHSWLHDLQIEMTCPTGATVVLDQFRGVGSGGPLFMGVPNDSDTSATPVPGTGFEYCWTPTAVQQMLDWGSSGTLPAGEYAPSCALTGFESCTLNGDWTIKVTDMWGADNGFIFAWGIKFDPAIVEDCEDWPVD